MMTTYKHIVRSCLVGEADAGNDRHDHRAYTTSLTTNLPEHSCAVTWSEYLVL